MEGLLAGGPRHVLVFDHVFQLAFHRDDEEHDEVHDQNGPEYGHVKHLEQGARESDKGCACSPPPKLNYLISYLFKLILNLLVRS